jgi:hypothetical protein
VDVALGDGEAALADPARRALFVIDYAAANAAAIALSGTAVCGLQLQWYVAIPILAVALATLQALVLRFAGLRVSALRWWPLTFVGTIVVAPVAFTVVYVLAVVILGGLSILGVEQGADVAAALVLILPAAVGGVIVGGLQFVAFRAPPDPIIVLWVGANAFAGSIGAPAIENVALGCAHIGIGPAWIESPIGWLVGGAMGGALTGLVLAKLRIPR